jgi:DNA-binding NarL/FixJ family response regulator
MFGEQRKNGRVRPRREQAIIELVAQGLRNRDIAEAVGTTEYVIKNHLRAIYDKLGLWNRVELALWYETRQHENQTSGETASTTAVGDPHAIPTSEVS